MVDSTGEFISFRGFTIICKVFDTEAMAGLESLIRNSKTLGKYVVPTPTSSYHMTVTGLNDEKLTAKTLKNLKEMCSKNAFPIGAEILDVYFGATPGISLKVPPKMNVLRNLLRKTAGMGQEPSYSYHITFGYTFRPLEQGDYEGYAEDITEIKRYIFSMFPTSDDVIRLKAAAVCAFEDMKNFVEI
jgi:hypothetical protein